jgi:hypothetical protein
VATYCRVSVPDVASCAKKGSFKPSINLSADHETGLADESPRVWWTLQVHERLAV